MKTIPLINDERVAVVDDKHYELLSQYRWYEIGGYAATSINGRHVRMHRMILGLTYEDGLEVDHINGNKLDNRRDNLRLVDRNTNMANRPKPKGQHSSIYKGVCRRPGKWEANIKYNGVKIYLGRFTSEIEAAKAYDRKYYELYGYSVLAMNFPEDYTDE